jgi:uncharacterized protein YjbI with pentapeptide repeats
LNPITQKELQEILHLHNMWLCGNDGGVRANLSDANLSDANLSDANLSDADLSVANLRVANLRGANLSGADLRGANLSGADLRGADLRDADLSVANLSGANLSGAKNIKSVKYDENTSFFALQCPEKGEYVAYKKAHGLIIELKIPADALRSSATSRKCRASKATVISITDAAGNPAGTKVPSDYDSNFVYEIGKTVEVSSFNTDRWSECSAGIHHFITRQEAVNYA